jgi:hypothetical protein
MLMKKPGDGMGVLHSHLVNLCLRETDLFVGSLGIAPIGPAIRFQVAHRDVFFCPRPTVILVLLVLLVLVRVHRDG